MDDLATLVVNFTANLDAVTSAGSDFAAVCDGMAAQASESASAITESLTGATEGFAALAEAAGAAGTDIGDGMLVAYDQIGQIGAAGEDAAAAIGDAMAQASASLSEAGTAASQASGSVSAIFAGADATPVVTAVDIAQANLTILQDKVQQARDKLQTLQNAANAGEAVTGIDTARAQLTLLEAKVQDARETLQSLGTQAEETGQEVETGMSQASRGPELFGGGLSDLVNKVGITIFSLQNMINVGQQVASSLLGPAMAAEQVQQSFTNLLGSSKAAADELNQLNTFAAKTQFKTQDIDLAASTMIGFGYAAKSVVPDLTAIGDALTAVGRGTPAEMQSVVDIFGKIQTQGKLTQGDLTEMGAHGINALSLIAQGAGKTTAQIQEMVKNGTLPANQAITDLTQGIEKNPIYAGGMAKQAGTLTGLLSTLKSNFAQVLAAFGSPILQAVEPLVSNIANSFSSPGFKTFAGSIGKGLVDVFSQLGGALHGVNIGGLTAQFGAFASKLNFKPVIDLLATAFKTVAQVLGSINFGNVGATLSTLAGIVSGVLGHAFTVLGPILAQVFKWFSDDLLPVLNQVLPPIGNLLNAVISLVGAALQPLIEALEPLIPPILQIAGNIASLLTPAIQGLIPVIKFIAPLIQAATIPLQIMLNLLSGNWKGALDAIGLGFLTTGDKALQMKIKVAEAHTQMAAITAQKTAEGAAKAISNMEIERQGILQKLKETHDPAEKAELEHQLNMLNIDEKAQESKLQKAEDDKKALLKKQKNLHDAMLEAQKSGLQRLLDSLGSWFSGLPGTVGGWFSNFGTFWHNSWQNLVNGLSHIWSGITGTIKGAINSVIDVINGFINGLDRIHVNVPGVGNVGFSIPDIPHLAAGGVVPPGGMALAGETGKPEIVLGGMSGTTVLGVSQTAALLHGGSNTPIENHIHVYLDGRQIGTAVADSVGNAMVDMVRSEGPVGKVA